MKRLGTALLVVVSLCAYIAIMVWAYGSWTGYFSDPARAALVVVVLALSVAATFTNSSGIGSGVREDKSNRWVLLPLIAGGTLLVWLAPYLDRHNESVWGGETVRWIGVVLTAAGSTLRLIPVFALGRRFSGLVAIQPDHKLKTDGVYSLIRHPSYCGLIVATFGWALVFRCVVPGILLTAMMAAVLIARMNSEERLLADQFGDEYAEYRKHTWRLVPWMY